MPRDARWSHVMPGGARWSCVVPDGATWCDVELRSARWSCVVPGGTRWCCCMEPRGACRIFQWTLQPHTVPCARCAYQISRDTDLSSASMPQEVHTKLRGLVYIRLIVVIISASPPFMMSTWTSPRGAGVISATPGRFCLPSADVSTPCTRYSFKDE